ILLLSALLIACPDNDPDPDPMGGGDRGTVRDLGADGGATISDGAVGADGGSDAATDGSLPGDGGADGGAVDGGATDGGAIDGGAETDGGGAIDSGVADGGPPDMGGPITCNPASQPFGGGAGTTASPHLLCTANHLDRMRDPGNEGFVYRMTTNIDLSQSTVPFAPIPRLTGVLDGQGFALFSLDLNDASGQDLALIARLEGTVRNLNLPDVRVTGDQRVASVAYQLADNTGARVENVFVSGELTVARGEAGGVVGTVGRGAVVDGAVFSGAIVNTLASGDGAIGGCAVTVADGGSMRRVLSQATLTTATPQAGGVAAEVAGEISECLSRAIIDSTSSQVGGIAGVLTGSGTIRDCFVGAEIGVDSMLSGGVYGDATQLVLPRLERVISVVRSGRTNVDALGGADLNASAVSSAVFDSDVVTAGTRFAAATGLTTAVLTSGSTAMAPLPAFARPEWSFQPGFYPTPAFAVSLVPPQVPCLTTGSPFGGGTGARNRPFVVCSVAQLDAIRNSLDAHFVLTQDIDLQGATFSPIPGPFTGSFDGRGFALRNWSHNAPNDANIAFFLEVSGQIENLSLLDVDLSASQNIAGLALDTTAGTSASLTNVRVTGRLSAANGNLSGIVGALRSGAVLESASFEGTLTSSAGQFHGGVIRALLAGGSAQEVSARGLLDLRGTAQKAGGIASDVNGELLRAASRMRIVSASGVRVAGIAAVLGTGALVRDVYASNRIELPTTTTLVGGLFGEEFQTGARTVDRALFFGNFVGPAMRPSPVFGRYDNQAALSDVAFDFDLNPVTLNIMGVDDLSTAQMQDPNSFFGFPQPPWIFSSGQYPRLDFEAP
ncbi:MAG: hypothetical protein AAFU79_02625, partial [Myxococcota bacterium]